jgi:hypothetical protein
MYAIAAIGLTTIILSLIMIVRPERWASGMLTFAEMRYFHQFEFMSRFFLGAVILVFADSTSFPFFFKVMGGVFVLAGTILVFMGSQRHRKLAEKFSTFGKLFRYAGFASLAFGIFVVYAALW